MIPKQDVLDAAKQLGLPPTTIEKDYALGWFLYGISAHSKLEKWIFKGGTCLKKCFFETYRFSEDLDFTVPENAVYNITDIEKSLYELAEWIGDESGIDCNLHPIKIEELKNPRGNTTFCANVRFSGPLQMPKRMQQRIKFDITNDELVVDSIDNREIHHPYRDAIDPSPLVRCYSVNDILAEKARALVERSGRARDVFDLVNISRNFREDVSPEIARDSVFKKFNFKGLEIPTPESIVNSIDPQILDANWKDQLDHQLQVLPPSVDYYKDIPDSLSWWMDESYIVRELPTVTSSDPVVPKERFMRAYDLSVPNRRVGVGRNATTPYLGSPFSQSLDQIRFAARNHLLVEIIYKGIPRLVEPYSLRRPNTGNLLLYVYEVQRGGAPGGGIKAFMVSKIQGVDVTPNVFSP
ncbi:MAG: nucleotidyl transferase AbiEii/AbiGii toxin family protein, partial [Bdellovibrionales bacterium]|nr:nucleotidyl transferase AbiEii/AbiGii toxin family protein [Bdellovibrionales bacterium]